MSSIRELFQREKELALWWGQIARDDRFAKVCTYARAEMMQAKPSQAASEGAEYILRLQTELAEADESQADFPSPGLHHEFFTKVEPQPATPT